MKDEAGKLKANIFFMAYTKDGAGLAGRSRSRSTAAPVPLRSGFTWAPSAPSAS